MTYVYRKEDAEGTFTIVNETMNALYEAVEKAINTRVDRCATRRERHWLTCKHWWDEKCPSTAATIRRDVKQRSKLPSFMFFPSLDAPRPQQLYPGGGPRGYQMRFSPLCGPIPVPPSRPAHGAPLVTSVPSARTERGAQAGEGDPSKHPTAAPVIPEPSNPLRHKALVVSDSPALSLGRTEWAKGAKNPVTFLKCPSLQTRESRLFELERLRRGG